MLVPGPTSAATAPSLQGTEAGSTEPLAQQPDSNRPFPQRVQYARGALRVSTPQASADVTTLRHWESWKATYLKSEGSPGLWVEHTPNTNVSEGTGYGMVFAAYFGDRPVFEGLYRHFRAHPSVNAADLMAWKQQLVAGSMIDVEDSDSATDGDMDIAYALLLADRQWGSAGSIDFAHEARLVSRAVLAHDVNHRYWNTTPGDWARGDDARHTRTSDFMPTHIRAFELADPGRARQWRRVSRSITRIVRQQYSNGSRSTGLLPDFMELRGGRWRPVAGKYLEGPHDGDFDYNACRDPWRLTLSNLVIANSDLKQVMTTQARWFRTASRGRPGRIRAGYYVANGPNGKPYADYEDLAFTAPVAVNAMLGGRAGQPWLDRLWRHITSEPPVTNYYSDSLRLMALLVLNRNWWQP